MIRFILSWALFLSGMAGLAPLHAAQNSKRPSAPSPTLLVASHVATTAKAAKNLVKAAGAVINQEVMQAEAKAKMLASSSGKALGNGLARVTAYWTGEDFYTRRHVSSTGVKLHTGHCAVDPTVIPYGSVVQIDGVGAFLAVDTGTAVVSRRAARKSGHTKIERHALVVDIFFESREEAEQFAAGGARFASVTWSAPETQVAIEGGAQPTLLAFDDTARGKSF